MWTIRRAVTADAAAISRLIRATLRHSNAADYEAATVARLVRAFDLRAVRGMLDRRVVWVAVAAGRIVGTAALEGSALRSVFVAPGAQGAGIGTALVAHVLAFARGLGLADVSVSSSVTAERFYLARGFQGLGDSWFGAERTIALHYPLAQG